MSSLHPQDRVSLCRFTYSDHRKCLTPRAPNHPHFCFFHSRQESRARTADNISKDLAYFFSGNYLSANDLCAALGRLMPAVARGDIKPRTASTLAYLAQTLSQTIHQAQEEYIYAYGAPAWGDAIRQSVTSNANHYSEDESQPTPDPESAPNAAPPEAHDPALESKSPNSTNPDSIPEPAQETEPASAPVSPAAARTNSTPRSARPNRRPTGRNSATTHQPQNSESTANTPAPTPA